ncbi:MAG: amidohydrolase [Planctomycetes bacterium]|nr:amidohydrolase [Planctomycetota bacterium]
MRLDAHQHFWRYRPEEYPWIGAGMERLARDHLPADLAPLAAAAGISGTVAVQARQSLAETEWLLDLAETSALVRGVVGWVDLRSATVADDLARLARRPALVGVRHVVQDEPDPRFLLGAAFVRGIGQLAAHGLAYDLLVYPHQLAAAEELVAHFPGQRFVLDHLGKPAVKRGEVAPWRDDIGRLARHAHCWCKLSGLVTEAAWQEWSRAQFTPYLEVALEAFSPARLLFGSDWPVCTLAAPYADVVGIVEDFVARLAPGEREAIMGGSCAAFYRLPEADSPTERRR